jgi:hypothetical protein
MILVNERLTLRGRRYDEGDGDAILRRLQLQAPHRARPGRGRPWSDPVRLSDLESRFVCKRCGNRGADVRPDFPPAEMGGAVKIGASETR